MFLLKGLALKHELSYLPQGLQIRNFNHVDYIRFHLGRALGLTSYS